VSTLKPYQQVRFRFYGKGHSEPITGHLYLRYVPEIQKWRMTSWQRSTGERSVTEGEVLADGGRHMVAELVTFLDAWKIAQQQAVDEHARWSSLFRKADLLRKPGFRPITAGRQWHEYIRDITAEIALLEADWYEVLNALRVTGWHPDPVAPFPVINIPHIVWSTT